MQSWFIICDRRQTTLQPTSPELWNTVQVKSSLWVKIIFFLPFCAVKHRPCSLVLLVGRKSMFQTYDKHHGWKIVTSPHFTEVGLEKIDRTWKNWTHGNCLFAFIYDRIRLVLIQSQLLWCYDAMWGPKKKINLPHELMDYFHLGNRLSLANLFKWIFLKPAVWAADCGKQWCIKPCNRQ